MHKDAHAFAHRVIDPSVREPIGLLRPAGVTHGSRLAHELVVVITVTTLLGD
jgi:hypothetical protein